MDKIQLWQLAANKAVEQAAVEAMCTPSIMTLPPEEIRVMAGRAPLDPTSLPSRLAHALALIFMAAQGLDIAFGEALSHFDNVARARWEALDEWQASCERLGIEAAATAMADQPSVQSYLVQSGLERDEALADLQWAHGERCIRNHS